MKKLTYFLSVLGVVALMLNGCSSSGHDEPVPTPEEFLASDAPSNRVAVLEDFTGVRCGYCPDGHIRAKQVQDANPGKFIIIATHAGGYAVAKTNWNNFTTVQGTAIDAQAKPYGYPAGTVNRMNCADLGVTPMNASYSNMTMDRGKWGTAANKVFTLAAPVNIGAKATFDAGSRKLTVKVDLYYTTGETVPNNINVSLLQNNVSSTQSDYTLPSPYYSYNYMQNHVLRDMLTAGNWGEQITEPTATGSKVSKTYTYTVPNDYHGTGAEGGGAVVIDDLSVVVFVTRGQLEILNAKEVDVK